MSVRTFANEQRTANSLEMMAGETDKRIDRRAARTRQALHDALISLVPVASPKNLSETCFVASRKKRSQLRYAEGSNPGSPTAPGWAGPDSPHDRLR